MRWLNGRNLGIFLTFIFLHVENSAMAFDLSDIQTFDVGGSKVILKSTPDFQEIIAFQMSIKAGAAVTNRPGLLELLTKTLPSGTPSYTKDQIDQIFVENGASFGIEPRGDQIEVTVKCLKKFLPTILPVVSEMIRVPLLTPDEVELSRKRQTAELKNEWENPDGIIGLITSKALYNGHPYGIRPIGYLETLPSLKRDELIDLLPKIFHQKNIFYTIIGDLSKEETQTLLETYFSRLPKEGPLTPPVTQPLSFPSNGVVFHKFDAPTTYFMARFAAPSIQNEDYPPLSLALQILDNRLFEEVRTKRGLTYAVSASMGFSRVNAGLLYVTSTKLKEAVEVMMTEVKRMQTEAIEPETIELQIRKFTSNWLLGRETSSSQTRILSMYEMIGGGWANANSFIDRLSKVTPADIQWVSQKYLQNFLIGMSGPEMIDLSASFPGAKLIGEKQAGKAKPTSSRVKKSKTKASSTPKKKKGL